MSDGVKGPNSPTYTPNLPPTGDEPSSPVINPKPQIPRTPSKAPKSILKNRTVQHSTTTKPQVNQKAREKMELENKSQNLIAQLEHLLTQQQFMAYKEALLEAIANPEALPEDFTVVYIDEKGQEVTVIPPDPQLQSNHEQETLLRNGLKARVYELDELFNDNDAEKIDEAIQTTSEQLEECHQQLIARGVESLSRSEVPQRVCLDPEFLSAPPKQIPLPVEDVFVLDEKPVTATDKKQHFNEKQFNDHWIKFYSSPGEKIPGQFYTLDDIRQFSDDELETTHDYVQLLFPNKHISEYNPGAPLLTNNIAQKIRETSALKNQVFKSIDQMLEFWGLERSDNNVAVNPQEAARHHKWDGQFDHNHKRITRMLDFLMECGQVRLASNIEQAMQGQRMAKHQGENSYWARAVGREPGAPRARTPVTVPTPPPQPTPASAPVKKVHRYTDYVNAFPYDQCQGRDRLDFYRSDKPGFVFTNFYKPQHPIRIEGELWPTTEHYYQACKFNKDSTQWKHIQSLPSPDAVYSYIYPNRPQDYRPIPLHTTEGEWLAKRDDVMMTALRAKANDVPEFRQALLDSGNKILFEVSPKDSYWGTAKDKKTGETGKNVLGAMLMQIRDELNGNFISTHGVLIDGQPSKK